MTDLLPIPARVRPRVFLPALALVPLVLAMTAGPALADSTPGLADCADPGLSLEKAVGSAEVVFVGTVTVVEGKSSWATVEVSEVWRGPDLERNVQIRGSVPPGQFGEDDRVLEVGVQYLFVPWVVEGAFQESICSPTTPMTPEWERLRPPDARGPLGGTATPTATSGPLDWLAPWIGPVGSALGLGAVILVVAFVAARRKDA